LDEHTWRGGGNLQRISLGMAIPATPTTVASVSQAIDAYEKDHNASFLQTCLKGVLLLPNDTGKPTHLSCEHRPLYQ